MKSTAEATVPPPLHNSDRLLEGPCGVRSEDVGLAVEANSERLAALSLIAPPAARSARELSATRLASVRALSSNRLASRSRASAVFNRASQIAGLPACSANSRYHTASLCNSRGSFIARASSSGSIVQTSPTSTGVVNTLSGDHPAAAHDSLQ